MYISVYLIHNSSKGDLFSKLTRYVNVSDGVEVGLGCGGAV